MAFKPPKHHEKLHKMNEILILVVALGGATALGYLFAWSLERGKVSANKIETERLQTALDREKSTAERFRSDLETHRLSLDNLQKLLQGVENQAFSTEVELKALRSENAKLKADLAQLREHPMEKIKEIEVIREVPVLVFRDINQLDNRQEKAKKLLHAFQKGYQMDEKQADPPAATL